MFKSNTMKVVTFFAMAFTVSPLFAGKINVYIDAEGKYDLNIRSLYYRIPGKYGSKESLFWNESNKSCTKTILTDENSPPTLLYFFWKNDKNQIFSLLPSKIQTGPWPSDYFVPTLPSLEKDGQPLRSLKITLGKPTKISDLVYGEIDEDIETCSTQEDHNADDDHNSDDKNSSM